MTFSYLCLSIGLMALVTYLPRVLPLILFRKRIENKTSLMYFPLQADGSPPYAAQLLRWVCPIFALGSCP